MINSERANLVCQKSAMLMQGVGGVNLNHISSF